MTLWQHVLKRFAVLVGAVSIAAVALLLARESSASAEIRGIWAGVAGMTAMDLLEHVIPPRRWR